jgi:6-pyruvoyl-tetrahydropterin synthase
MEHAPPIYRFQAAVERQLPLAFQNEDGQWEGHDYCVTAVAERKGLDSHGLVVDFRVLEAALSSVLETMRGHSLGELGLNGPLDAAKKIADALAPVIEPPARLAEVFLQDGAGRRITLRL